MAAVSIFQQFKNGVIQESNSVTGTSNDASDSLFPHPLKYLQELAKSLA